MSTSVTIKSADGAALTFKMLNPRKHDRTFEISCAHGSFRAKTVVKCPEDNLPSTLFREMAAEWRGWEKPKKWTDPDGKAHIQASIESTGNIILQIQLRDTQKVSAFQTIINFENCDLERNAFRIASAFNKSVA